MDWGAYGPGLTAALTVGAFILGGLWRVGKWFGTTQMQAAQFIEEQANMRKDFSEKHDEVKRDLMEIKKDQQETQKSIIDLRLENARRDGLGRDIEDLKTRVHSLEGKRA